MGNLVGVPYGCQQCENNATLRYTVSGPLEYLDQVDGSGVSLPAQPNRIHNLFSYCRKHSQTQSSVSQLPWTVEGLTTSSLEQRCQVCGEYTHAQHWELSRPASTVERNRTWFPTYYFEHDRIVGTVHRCADHPLDRSALPAELSFRSERQNPHGFYVK